MRGIYGNLCYMAEKSVSVVNMIDPQNSGVGHILIFGEVGSWTEREVRDFLKGQDFDEVHVYIASYGGDIFAGFMIYDFIAGLDVPTFAHIFGTAASIATVIASAADVVEISNQALYMIHNGAAFLYGRYEPDEIEETLRMLNAYQDRIISVYQKRSGLSESEITEMMARTEWMSPEQALGNRFVDSVVDSISIPFSELPESDGWIDDFGFYYSNTEKVQAQLVALGYHPSNSKDKMSKPSIKAAIEKELKARGYGQTNQPSEEEIEQITSAVVASLKGDGSADAGEGGENPLEKRLDDLSEKFDRLMETLSQNDEGEEDEADKSPAASAEPEPKEGDDELSAQITNLTDQVKALTQRLNAKGAANHGSGTKAPNNGEGLGEDDGEGDGEGDAKFVAFGPESGLGKKLAGAGVSPAQLKAMQARVRKKRKESAEA